MQAKKGEWVLIHNIVLAPSERAPQVPDDTKAVPLEMWVRGTLTHDAALNDEVEIKTNTGRLVKGKMIEIRPSYGHNFGKHVPETLAIGRQLKAYLFGGDSNE